MYFVDTNIFVYAHDESDLRKSENARKLLTQLIRTREGCISAQVIQEFCNVSLRKSAIPLKSEDVALIIQDLFKPLLAHRPSTEFYLNALKVYRRYSLSFYDALIVQAAIDLDCKAIYSEDMQTGAQYERVTIINPFA